MKACPYCAEQIQDDAIKCRFCGEMLTDLSGRKVSAAEADAFLRKTNGPKRKGSPLLKFLGALLFLGGLGLGLYYFAYFDTSVPVPQTEILGRTFGGGRVHNIGLMQERQNGLMFGGGAVIVGLALVVLGDRINT